MIQRNEADVPEMLTEPGKWLDDDTLLFEGTSETRHQPLLSQFSQNFGQNLGLHVCRDLCLYFRFQIG
jgi:hypothetical protein